MRVNARTNTWICTALWALLVATPVSAADDAALLKDLTSVITLLGLPCGRVVSATTVKGDEHVATCQDGNRYRVYINADGRVVAQSLKP